MSKRQNNEKLTYRQIYNSIVIRQIWTIILNKQISLKNIEYEILSRAWFI